MDMIAAYREEGTYRGAAVMCGTTHRTVGNLSHLPAETIELIKASLAGKAYVEAGVGSTSPAPSRTAMWRPCGPRPGPSACPSCWVLPAPSVTWRSP
ncbi:MAG: hypothetical protein ACRDJ4_00150, partial [Actinomycetota bacterium]